MAGPVAAAIAPGRAGRAHRYLHRPTGHAGVYPIFQDAPVPPQLVPILREAVVLLNKQKVTPNVVFPDTGRIRVFVSR